MFDFTSRVDAFFADKPRGPLDYAALFIVARDQDAAQAILSLLTTRDERISMWLLCTPAQFANIPIQPQVSAMAFLVDDSLTLSEPLRQSCIELLTRAATALGVEPESLIEYVTPPNTEI